jgi:putative N6-adenine-specific DNA methylase
MNINRIIKQKIWSKEHNYFLVVQPGLEDILKKEIESFGYNIESEAVGGVEVKGKLETLYDLSLRSRVATKILFRLVHFKANHISDIKKGLKKVDFCLFWPKNTNFNISVTSKSSKLYHTDMVKEFILKEILSLSELNDLNYNLYKKSLETLFVRIENNEITISLDSSGDFLYKRNIKKKANIAPLRENVAASLLLKFWNKEKFLLDPMCGSGTFSIEASLIKNNIPSGYDREFNFMNWVNFRDKTFSFLKSKYLEDINFDIKNIEASDINEDFVNNANENLSLFNGLIVKKENFFDIIPSKESGFIVINLPYNKRIKVDSDFYQKVEKKLKKDFKKWEYLILVSKNHKFNKLKKDSLKIKNGGILLDIYHGII